MVVKIEDKLNIMIFLAILRKNINQMRITKGDGTGNAQRAMRVIKIPAGGINDIVKLF